MQVQILPGEPSISCRYVCTLGAPRLSNCRMKKKPKTLDLEKIPEVLEKITLVIDQQVEILQEKAELTAEDCKNLIAYAGCLSAIYKDYRVQILEIRKELKDMPKDQIMSIVKSEVK